MVLTISTVLVLMPTHDAYVTDKHLKLAYGAGGWLNPVAASGCADVNSPSAVSSHQLEAGMRRREEEEEDRGEDRHEGEDVPSDEPDLATTSNPPTPHTPLVIK